MYSLTDFDSLYSKRRQYMRALVCVLILFLLIGFVKAQEKSAISGRIFDASTNTALPEANIWIKDRSRGEVSDFRGYYEIKNLEPGEYTIVISYIGFERAEKTITLGEGERKNVEVYLHEQPLLLVEEIVVTGTRPATYIQTEYHRKDYESQQVNDLGKLMRNVPNVSAIRRGGYGLDPVLRGFKYDQLNVQVDGGARIEGACPSRMDPAMAHMSAGDLEKIEILKGPYALRFGPSFGGVVNMVTAAPERFESFTVGAYLESGYESNIDGWQNRVSVSGGSSIIDFRLSGGLARYNNYTDGAGNEIPSSYDKSDYTVKLGINPALNHRLQVSFRQVFARDVMFPSLPMDERKDDTSIIILDYAARNLSSSVTSLNLKAYRSDVSHIMDNRDKPTSVMTDAVTDVTTSVWGFRTETGLLIGSNFLFAGIDYAQTDKTGFRTREFIAGPRLGTIITDNVWQGASILNAGVFAEFRSSVSDVQIVGAVRADYNKAESTEPDEAFSLLYDSMRSEYTNLSISAGVTKAVSRNLELSLFAGRGIRSPGISERYINFLPVGVDRYDYIGDPKLDPEVNNNADLGVRLRTPSGMITGNIYYSYVIDFISPERTDLQGKNMDVLGVKRFTNISSASLTGFEFGYTAVFGGMLHLSTQASYTRGKNNTTDEWLPEIPPFEGRISMGIALFNGTLTPEISLRAAVRQNNISESFGETSTPGFVLAHFSVRFTPSRHINISAGVNNIFDKAYYEHLNRKNQADGRFLYEPGRVFYISMGLSTR
jgi:iron complex outermembrane recepter protein